MVSMCMARFHMHNLKKKKLNIIRDFCFLHPQIFPILHPMVVFAMLGTATNCLCMVEAGEMNGFLSVVVLLSGSVYKSVYALEQTAFKMQTGLVMKAMEEEMWKERMDSST